MPKRDDIKKILVIGSGPIVIGQACEFDYSGTQACKALREEGYEVVLVNSNPATIMTDPAVADRTYVEPLVPEVVERILERERPDALLPTVGGQTALNLTVALGGAGHVERLGVQLIGANLEAIHKAEDREAFKQAMAASGLATPSSGTCAIAGAGAGDWSGRDRLPADRPALVHAGRNRGAGPRTTSRSSSASSPRASRPARRTEVLIEQSVLGWKEYELEVMRDLDDNVVVICSIENFDAMGVHTGRLDHGRAGADPDRQGIPADARRGDRRDPRDRGRDRRLQHPVRGRSGQRRAWSSSR